MGSLEGFARLLSGDDESADSVSDIPPVCVCGSFGNCFFRLEMPMLEKKSSRDAAFFRSFF